jgi:hypothetical protein
VLLLWLGIIGMVLYTRERRRAARALTTFQEPNIHDVQPDRVTPKLNDTLAATDLRKQLSLENNLDEIFISPGDGSILGLSFDDEQVVLGRGQLVKRYAFGAISAVEIVRNGVTVTQTNRGSQLISAAVGGALFGGVGALAGALTGSSSSRERLAGLTIKIMVDDSTTPVHEVQVLRPRRGKGVDATSKVGAAALGLTNRLHGQLILAMRRAAGTDRADASSNDVRSSSVHVLSWGRIIAVQLIQPLQEAKPELSVGEVMREAVRLQKSAPATIDVATPGDARRLAEGLAAAGAVIEAAPPV